MSNDVEVSAKQLRAVQGRAVKNGCFCFKCQQSYFDKHQCPNAGLSFRKPGGDNLPELEQRVKYFSEMWNLYMGMFENVVGVERQFEKIDKLEAYLLEIKKELAVVRKNTRPLTDKLLGKE